MESRESYQVATDPDFRNRVEILIKKAAIAISGEEPKPSGTYQPAAVLKRGNLSKSILDDLTRTEEQRFSFALVSDGNINKDTSDADIYARISAIFNHMAGVTWNDLQPV